MVYSKIDQFYRSLLLTKFFTKGWGKPDNLKRIFAFRKILSNRESCQTLVGKDYPITIDKDYKDGDCRIMEGHFKSPFVDHMPGIMPKEVETASFQAILPLQWQQPTLKPICIHLAGTGDHFFWRRRLFTARPLLKHAGIASILLENPYYGSRKPKSQIRSSLHNVSDLFVMGGALVLESLALLHWCERQGWGPFGLSGVSMGGHNACAAATVWPKPISVVPFLSWTTASMALTKGVMSGAIPWQVLQEQFFKNNLYHDEISKLIISPEKAYDMGQQFVINYSQDLKKSKSSKSTIFQKRTETTNQQKNNDSEKKPSIFNNSLSLEEGESKPEFAFTESSSSSSNMTSSPSRPLNKTDHNLNTADNLNISSQESSSAPLSHTKTESKGIRSKTKLLPRGKTRHLTLNYAHTKQWQQSPNTSDSKKEKNSLTLNHAEAKSKIKIFPNKNEEKERDNFGKLRNLQEESYEFMRGVMDECTHLANFSVPVDPELVIIVSATQDAYIPRDGVLPLDKLWPGCEVRYVDQGHIGAVLLHQNVFRRAVTDAFEKQVRKYYPGQVDEVKRIWKTSKKR